jgi:hypothetical protein
VQFTSLVFHTHRAVSNFSWSLNTPTCATHPTPTSIMNIIFASPARSISMLLRFLYSHVTMQIICIPARQQFMAIRCSVCWSLIASPSLPIACTHGKVVIRKGPDDPCSNGQKLRLMIQRRTALLRPAQKCIFAPPGALLHLLRCIIPHKPFIILSGVWLLSAKTKVFAPFDAGNNSWRRSLRSSSWIKTHFAPPPY